MGRVIGKVGAALLLATSFFTVLMLALETCENGTASYFYSALVRFGYINLIALFLMWIGYRDRDNIGRLVVCCNQYPRHVLVYGARVSGF
ncbi:MAG: hypothetical protein R2827_05335 [Bdellovibrionales bacterium]